MRILLVSNCYPPNFIGGAELVVHRHAQRLQQLGHTVRVFAGEHAAPAARHARWNDNYEGVDVTRVRITHIETDHRRTNFLNQAVARHFGEMLDEWRPDVAHFHNTAGLSLSAYHQCSVRNVPVLITLHDHWGFCLRNTLTTAQGARCEDIRACAGCLPAVEGGPRLIPVACRQDYLRRRFACVSRFITPSAYLASAYSKAGFPADRFEVISNGIDPSRINVARADNAPCRFTTICYLGEHKGLHIIMEALHRLPRQLNWQFNIVGIGHLLPTLKRMVRVAGFEHRVRFWGRLSNDRIPSILEATDVYVLASVWAENEPVSILEALAHGIPVIASRVGGVPELVQTGVNGWLVPDSDPDALQAAFLEAITDRSGLQRVAAGAQRVGTSWPELRQVGRILSAYELVRSSPLPKPTAPLIAVAGNQMTDPMQAAIAAIKSRQPNCDVIPIEWLEPEELREAHAFIVPNDGDDVVGSSATSPKIAAAEVARWVCAPDFPRPVLAPSVAPEFFKN